MAKLRGDFDTLDLFASESAPVRRFEFAEVREASLREKIAKAVSLSLVAYSQKSGKDRKAIAEEMSLWLGEEVSENMLNNYASRGAKEHTIPYLRLLALIQVTEDERLLQLGAELFGLSVIDDKYLEWVEVGQKADKREQVSQLGREIEKDFDLALRQARRGARL